MYADSRSDALPSEVILSDTSMNSRPCGPYSASNIFIDEEEEEAEESHDIEQDPELMAEMAALAAIQRERDGMDEVEKDNYNSSGLLKCIDEMETSKLPFKETLVVSEFEIEVPDENDDLEREVSSCVYVYSSDHSFAHSHS